MQVALTIAGSDSGGGAGIQADLKTFAAFGVFGTSVITALTAQNTLGVHEVAEVEPAFILAQLTAVSEDFAIAAAKTGMLANAAVIEAVAEHLKRRRIRKLVVDPVMVAASGDILLAPEAVGAMRKLMLPLASLATPNLREAEILSGLEVVDVASMRAAARAIVSMGAAAVLVKGGRLGGAQSVDVLATDGEIREFSAPRIRVERAHGTGCTLSAAVTASLALGAELGDAIDAGKRFVTDALATAPRVGHGATPLNHMVKPTVRGAGDR
ncbi:MAG TPA: bifunctional hydroxymethylpyrimidine kinase/phosphomethylpyrimidine kinase [Candidatus Binataceae bacterium]|nr:bifunctional hydroxymethylpyrimidine kinase/phosphomethylpyrimidine kinase [Candidatus Binataceae bacterium]